MMRIKAVVLGAIIVIAAGVPVVAQVGTPDLAGGTSRRTIWDLRLGEHAREIPRADYVDLACGTNGGPPSIPLDDFGQIGRAAQPHHLNVCGLIESRQRDAGSIV